MIIGKVELSEKLKNLKSVSSPKLQTGGQGVLYKDGCLIANNLMIAIRAVLFEEGTDENFIIPMDAIEFIAKLPNEEIEITSGKNNEIKVKCGKIKGKFPSLDPSLFPETCSETIEANAEVRISGEDIEQYVSQIMYACPVEANKPIFQGILFDGKGKGVNVVACDGYRIAVNKLSTTQEIYVVVPREAMQKIISVIDTKQDVLIKAEEKQVVVSTGDYTVYAKKLDGEYIDYKSAFPKEATATFHVNKKLLLDCLTRSIICYGVDKSACGIMTGKKGEDKITITNRTKLNHFEEEIQLDSLLAADMEIGFNSKLLQEAVKASDEGNIILQYSDSLKPLLVCDSKLRQLVLPVRLGAGGAK